MSRAQSRAELAERLTTLAEHMLDVAVEMEFFGGFDQELINKSRELAGASALARQWAHGIGQPTDQATNHADQRQP